MTATVTHAAEVKRLVRPRGWHIAVCACGWQGKPCTTRDKAQIWADNHNRNRWHR